jgi:hypothetical protein
VNPGRNEIQDVKLQAASLLRQLSGQEGKPQEGLADDILLFLYRIRDGHETFHSTNTPSMVNELVHLQDVVYQLESRPDRTLESEEWKARVESLLRCLAEGRWKLEKKGTAPPRR